MGGYTITLPNRKSLDTEVTKNRFLKEVIQHQAVIYKVCRMYRDTEEDREDLFQEIIYQLWKSYPKFQGKSKISTWIYRIGLNTAMATFRQPKLKIITNASVPEHPSSIHPVDAPSRDELLFAAIRKLNEDERALIGLYLEEMTYLEIGDILGISENNVGVRLTRIKKKLKELLKISL